MGYLFGDSTPFPVEDNFLATLADLTEACVVLLQVDADLESARTEAEGAKDAAARELARLEGVASTLVRGLEPHIADIESQNAAEAARRVLQAARGVLETARAENASHRDGMLRDIESNVAQRRAALLRALETFLSRHEIPGTQWQLRWRAGIAAAQSQAQAKATLPCAIDAVMELAIPLGSPWSSTPRVAELEKHIAIRLPFDKRFLRSAGLRPVKLDGWSIVEVDHGPERQSMTLRRHVGKPSDGVEIILRNGDDEEPTARRLSTGNVPVGDPVCLVGADLITAKRLWSRVRASLEELKAHRRRLVSGTSDGVALRDVVRPARVAEKLIEVVAPLVRELRKRGATSSELVLKRDLASGRREELFLPVTDLTRLMPSLTPGRRALFDAWQLSTAVANVIDRRLPGMPPPPPPVAALRKSAPRAAVPNPIDDEDDIDTGDQLEREDTQVETHEFRGPRQAVAILH